MIRRIKAWINLLKLGSVIKLSKEVNTCYRDMVLESLQKEGFISFIKEPRTLDEIIEEFGYTDREYLEDLIETLLSDKTVVKKDNKYYIKKKIKITNIKPRVYNKSVIEFLRGFANAIPGRLKGKYHMATTGYNLFCMDDTLSLQMYKTIRRSAFMFSDALNRKGKFLDVGCANGIGTADIWSMYWKKGYFNQQKQIDIYGIDVNRDLLKIAEEEFPLKIRKILEMTDEEVNQYKDIFPKLKEGTATDIPFEDDYFDIVYISQVLHWTDPRKAIKELHRIVKPDGIVFGAQLLKPTANEYNHILLKTIEGAHGYFTKNDMKEYIKEAGFKNISFATPLATFILTK